VNDDEKLACEVGAESHEALLVVRGIVVSRQGAGIEENAFRVGKANAVLPEVAARLPGIPGDGHICIVCIFDVLSSAELRTRDVPMHRTIVGRLDNSRSRA
jgi:hypothetical protein